MRTYSLSFERSTVATLNLPTELDFIVDEPLLDAIIAAFRQQLEKDQVEFTTIGPVYINGKTKKITADLRKPSYKFTIQSTGFTKEDR